MTAQEQERTEETLSGALPASERRGVPGHDQAHDRAAGAELMRLRMMGLSYAQIAQEAGYADGSGARNALLRALDRHEAENATQLRTVENLRLDADERALRSIIGDPTAPAVTKIKAIDSRTRLSARRSRLNGLDAPVQVQFDIDTAREMLLEKLRSLRPKPPVLEAPDDGEIVDGEILEQEPTHD